MKILLGVALAFAWAIPAQAIETAVHDDGALTGPNAEVWTQRAQDMGVDSIRAIVYGPQALKGQSIDRLVARNARHGVKTQVTLHWNEWEIEGMTTSAYVAYARMAVARFPTVTRFSILNEPDLTLPAQPRECGNFIRSVGHFETYPKFRYRRAWTPRRIRKMRAYRRFKDGVGRRYARKRVGTRKAMAWTARGHFYVKRRRKIGVYVPRLFEERSYHCREQTRGAAYRALYRKTYTAIKQVRPDAQVWFGETSPNASAFLSHAVCTKPSTGDCSLLKADGRAHHAYQWRNPPETCAQDIPEWLVGPGTGGVGCTKEMIAWNRDVARAGRLRTPGGAPVPLYLTEFGFLAQPMDTRYPAMDEQQAAEWALRATRVAANGGARQLVWYQIAPSPDGWTSPQGWMWDTSLYSASGPRPVYTALARSTETQ